MVWPPLPIGPTGSHTAISFKRNAHGEAGIAAQVLVGQKENALAAREGPLKGRARIGRGADQAAALAAKSLDGGGRSSCR